MENNETYFKILIDKIVEQNNEINKLKFEIEELRKSKLSTDDELDELFETVKNNLNFNKVGVKNETKYRR